MIDPTNTALVAYVPVPHAGYLKFFREYEGAVLNIIGDEFIREFTPLVRNLPAVTPDEAVGMVLSLGLFANVQVLTKQRLPFVREFSRVVMPDEDVSHELADQYFSGTEVTFDGRWRLRWDWGATTANRRPEVETVISHSEFDRTLLREATQLAQKSPDWWRQIGALLVKDGTVLLAACNTHLPSEQSAYLMGDPRSNFGPGEFIDASLAAHAEASIVAVAANRGISTNGCDLYVTTFPCPPCAGSVALAGIRRLFYIDGYSRVDGATSLVSRGVEIIRVEMQDAPVPA